MYLTGAIEAPVQASNDLWQVSVVVSGSQGMSKREHRSGERSSDLRLCSYAAMDAFLMHGSDPMQ